MLKALVALVLAVGLIPVCPAPAHADDFAWITGLSYDAHGGDNGYVQGTDGIDAWAFRNMPPAAGWPTIDASDATVSAQMTDTASALLDPTGDRYQQRLDLVQQANPGLEIKDFTMVLDTVSSPRAASVLSYDVDESSPASSDTSVATVAASADGWDIETHSGGSFVLSAPVTAARLSVGFDFSYRFTYTVHDPAGVLSDVEASGDVQGETATTEPFDYTLGASALTVAQTFDVSVAWNESALSTALANASGSPAFTYGDGPLTLPIDSVARLDELTPVFTLDEADAHLFDVQVAADNSSITVTPKNAFTGTKTVSITWAYPDSTAASPDFVLQNGGTDPVETTLNISIAAFDLSVGAIDDQPFRLKDDQLATVKQLLIDEISQGAGPRPAAADIGFTGDLFASDYPTSTAGGQVSLSSAAVGLTGDAATNFVLDFSGCTTFRVSAVTPRDDIIELRDADGDARNGWYNGTVAAKAPGFDLQPYAPSVGSSFVDTISWSSNAQGRNAHQLFARVRSGDPAQRIVYSTRIEYDYDDIAPLIARYSVGDPYVVHEGLWFYSDAVDVDFTLADASSGVDAPSVSGTFRDVRRGDVSSFGPGTIGGPENYRFTVPTDDREVVMSGVRLAASDKAGNAWADRAITDATSTPVGLDEIVTDGADPSISVIYDNNRSFGSYYPEQRRGTFIIVEANFAFIQRFDPQQEIVVITADGARSVLTPGAFSNPSGDGVTWVADYAFDLDASYTVSGRIIDPVGKTASLEDAFVVDRTAPGVSVVFDNNDVRNGMYYNASRTATITIVEHNFDSAAVSVETTAQPGNGSDVTAATVGGWVDDGDTHTAVVGFPGQGVYSLRVSGSDRAANTLPEYTSGDFCIDTIQPTIDISGIADRVGYRGAARPAVAFRDTNVDAATARYGVSKISLPRLDDANPYEGSAASTATSVDVTFADPAQTIGNDGVYTIEASLSDLAGNSVSQTVTWSVNRFGSTYVLSSDTKRMLNTYMNSDVAPDVAVTEINPSGLDPAAIAVELARDSRGSTLQRGDDYAFSEDASAGWYAYTYTVGKRNYDKDGVYRVLFHSRDLAGNVSENTMDDSDETRSAAAAVDFAIDDTAPICGFVNLSSGGVYDEATHTASVSIEDNLRLASARIDVDGNTVATFDAEELRASTTHEFSIEGSDRRSKVSVTAVDAAGNVSAPVTVENVLVNPDATAIVFRQMIGWGIGAAVLIGGGVIGLILYGRRRSARENPPATPAE